VVDVGEAEVVASRNSAAVWTRAWRLDVRRNKDFPDPESESRARAPSPRPSVASGHGTANPVQSNATHDVVESQLPDNCFPTNCEILLQNKTVGVQVDWRPKFRKFNSPVEAHKQFDVNLLF
jgi:hypothetical protein